MNRATILFLACLLPISLFAQKKKRFDGLEACQLLLSNLTLKQAEEGAVKEVKLRALTEAGLAEEISTVQLYRKSSIGSVNSDNFSESSTLSVRGEITKFEKLQVRQQINDQGAIQVCVAANIEVVQYNKPAKNAPSIVWSNFPQSLKSGDEMMFEVRLSKPGYLWIFLITPDEKFQQLFPSNYDASNFIEPEVDVHFPKSNLISWKVDAVEDVEMNEMIIVYSERNLSASGVSLNNFNSWSDWFQKLDYDSRIKVSKTFQIIK